MEERFVWYLHSIFKMEETFVWYLDSFMKMEEAFVGYLCCLLKIGRSFSRFEALGKSIIHGNGKNLSLFGIFQDLICSCENSSLHQTVLPVVP